MARSGRAEGNGAKLSQWSVFLRQSWEETAEALSQEGQDCFHVPAHPRRADATPVLTQRHTRPAISLGFHRWSQLTAGPWR